jgi:tetratricopeptide (TPR) repeat protein
MPRRPAPGHGPILSAITAVSVTALRSLEPGGTVPLQNGDNSDRMRRYAGRAYVCGLVLAACARAEVKPHTIAPSPSARVASSAVPDTSPHPGASSRPATPAIPAAPTAGELSQRRAYQKAMAKGRSATRRKDWPGAVAAFTEALDASTGDAGAYAERGYALLLAGSLDEAEANLDRAAKSASDARLLSSIWFNRGLVAEKRPDDESALVDFFLANRFSPSAAARAKIGGRKVCPVLISRSDASPPRLSDEPWVEADDWLGLWRAIKHEGNPEARSPSSNPKSAEPDTPDLEHPATAEAAREALTGQTGEVTLPLLLTTHFAGQEVFVVMAHGKKLRGRRLGWDTGGRCPQQLDFDMVSHEGNVLHVHGLEVRETGYGYRCEHEDAGDLDLGQCSEAELATVGPMQTFCPERTPTEHDVVIDLAKGDTLLAVERASGEITAKLEPNGLRLSGLGCDGLVPFVADAGSARPK